MNTAAAAFILGVESHKSLASVHPQTFDMEHENWDPRDDSTVNIWHYEASLVNLWGCNIV